MGNGIIDIKKWVKQDKPCNNIILGDCLDGMKLMDTNYVDTVITDPPYGLSAPKNSGKISKGGFMGKKWDYDIPSVEIWSECLRVLKPGGYLLSFCGTRTQHRMACNIEDAGFEIRDMICWLYGCLSEDTEILTPNGWEHYNKLKQLNIEQPILIYDLKNGIYKWEIPEKWNEYKINDTCYRIKSDSTDQLVSRNHRCLVEQEGKLVFKYAEALERKENIPFLESLLVQNKSSLQKVRGYDITEAEVTKVKYSGIIFCPTVSTGCFVARRNGKIFITGNSGFPKGLNISKSIESKILFNSGNTTEFQKLKGKKVNRNSTGGLGKMHFEQGDRPSNYDDEGQYTKDVDFITPEAKQWEGYGTALKPAMELITIAMKPIKGTFAENALEFGVAGLNIDGGRIPTDRSQEREFDKELASGKTGSNKCLFAMGDKQPRQDNWLDKGRYPANVILDETSAKLLDEHAPKTGQLAPTTGKEPSASTKNKIYGDYSMVAGKASTPRDKLSGASRFFYCPKVSELERNKGCSMIQFNCLEIVLSINDEIDDVIWSDKLIIQEENKVKHLVDMEQSLKKAIVEYGIKNKKDTDLNIMLYGKRILEKHLKDIKSITKMKINLTTVQQILNWLHHSTTNENIQDVFFETMVGGSRVKSVKNSYILTIIINESMGFHHGVNPVVLKMQLIIREKEGTNFHNTVKPLSLMEYLCKLTRPPTGGIVLDPFIGSGSTAIACKHTNRNYIGFEKDPDYYKIAKARIKMAVSINDWM